MPIHASIQRVHQSSLPNQEVIYPTGDGLYSVGDDGYAKAFMLLHQRQGGDPNNWATPGTTNYPAKSGRVYVGAAQWTGSAALGNVAVTFPITFAYTPIVIAVVGQHGESNIGDVGVQVSAVSASGCTIAWKTISGVSLTDVYLNWFAVGPMA